MMDKDVKKLWTDALRSGEYPQGVDFLKHVDKDGNAEYCCFGVLAEITDVPETLYEMTYGYACFTFPLSFGKVSTDAPQIPHQEWCASLGIETGDRNRLMAMNDGNGEYEAGPVNFADIAEWIDTNL